MRMSPQSLLITLVLSMPLAAADPAVFEFRVDADRLQGAADFSHLNHPLMPADRIFVRDGHFYAVGADLKAFTEDDARVRMFGVNLAFGGNFPEERDAARIAKRLRRCGVNLVRFHHMDSSPDAQAEDARSILTTGPYPTFNPVSMKRLKTFLGALKAEGIYANINLHVGYRFRPESDRVPALAGAEAIPSQSKPLHMLHPRMIELQLAYTRGLLGALEAKGDPVLAMIEINNETSLLWHWMTGSLDRYAQGEYARILEGKWEAWRASRRLAPATWRGVKEEIPESTRNEMAQFLAALDREYLDAMKQAAREAAGALVPVAGTQMGFSGLMLLDSHAGMDYHDEHFYIDHYNFPNRSWDDRDWRIRNSSAAGAGLSRILSVAAAMPLGKPYTVSEFNENWPNTNASEIDVVLAAIGAFQDWDAIMHFAYAHNREWDRGLPGGFDLTGDWTKLVNIGQSAWLFRSGALAPARTVLQLPAGRAHRLRFTRERRAGGILRYYEALGLEPLNVFRNGVRLNPNDDGGLARGWTEKKSGPVEAESGELIYDAAARRMLVNSAFAAGAVGHLGGGTVSAGVAEIELGATSREFATVLVTPVDGKPLAASGRLLVTAPGATWRSQEGVQPPAPVRLVPYPGTTDWFTLPSEEQGRPSGSRSGAGAAKPVWMERVELTLKLKRESASAKVYPLGAQGERLAALGGSAVEKTDGGWLLRLNGANQPPSPWFEVILE
jgi:hypothetical protein